MAYVRPTACLILTYFYVVIHIAHVHLLKHLLICLWMLISCNVPKKNTVFMAQNFYIGRYIITNQSYFPSVRFFACGILRTVFYILSLQCGKIPFVFCTSSLHPLTSTDFASIVSIKGPFLRAASQVHKNLHYQI